MSAPRNHEDVNNYLVFGAVNTFRYTNWEGETEDRRVIPHCLRFGRTEHHPEEQWLMEGYDCVRNAPRTFALKDIHPR